MAIVIGDATQPDFDEIHFWLKTEEAAWKALGDDRWKTVRGFFCNIGVIKSSFDDGEMRALREDGRLIGFMSYGLTRNGVMEVKAEERGKGYGRSMVQDAMRRAREDGRNALYIECAPKTSKPFWKSMDSICTAPLE